MLRAALAVAVQLVAGGVAMAQTGPADAAAAALGEGWNRGDGHAFAAQFWPDARFVNVLAHVYTGRGEIEAQHSRIFATIYKGSHGAFSVAHAQPLGPDHWLAELDGRLTGWTHLPPGVVTVDGAIVSHMVLVLERRGAQWGIIYAQNTAFTPLPARRPQRGSSSNFRMSVRWSGE